MSKKKIIGLTCDNYKADSFRKGLLKEGYQLEFDGASGIKGVHLFRIECEEEDFATMKEKCAKTMRKLDLDFKRRN